MILGLIAISAGVLFFAASARSRRWLFVGISVVGVVWAGLGVLLLAATANTNVPPNYEALVFRNQSDQSLYFVVDDGSSPAALATPGAIDASSGGVWPGGSVDLLLRGRWSEKRPLCPVAPLVMIESLSDELSYGDAVEIAPGLLREMVSQPADLRVVGRIPDTCRTRADAELIWDGSTLRSGPVRGGRSVPWWLIGCAAMPVAAWLGNRRRRRLRSAAVT